MAQGRKPGGWLGKTAIGCAVLLTAGVGVLFAIALIGLLIGLVMGPKDRAGQPPDQGSSAATGPSSGPTPFAPALSSLTAFAPGALVEVIGGGSGLIILAESEAIFEERRSGGGDFKLGRDLFGVGPGASAVVIEAKGDRLRVKMVGGNWPDRAGWIAAGQVRAKPTSERVGGDVRHGFTLEKRREIYAEIYRAGMLASYAAAQQVPTREFLADPDEFAQREAAHKAVYDEVKARGRCDMVERFKVTAATLDEIDSEGMAARWPLPEVENPFKAR